MLTCWLELNPAYQVKIILNNALFAVFNYYSGYNIVEN